jgi:hypothetical protein
MLASTYCPLEGDSPQCQCCCWCACCVVACVCRLLPLRRRCVRTLPQQPSSTPCTAHVPLQGRGRQVCLWTGMVVLQSSLTRLPRVTSRQLRLKLMQVTGIACPSLTRQPSSQFCTAFSSSAKPLTDPLLHRHVQVTRTMFIPFPLCAACSHGAQH